MTAYGMRISDVSSDVCSSVLRTAIFGFSDLEKGVVLARFDEIPLGIDHEQARFGALDLAADDQRGAKDRFGHRPFVAMAQDRKRVVSGKGGSVRVELGGRRIIKKKRNNTTTSNPSNIK